MRLPVDHRFLDEMEHFRLRLTCPDCGFRAPDGRCAHEWPQELHVRPPAAATPEVVFCKEFELL